MREKTELQRRLEEAYHRDACFCDVLPDASDALAAKDASIREYMDICEDLSRKLEASRHRVAELEEQFSLLKEIASNSVAALADLPDRQFAKFRIAELEAAIKPFAEEATNWLDGEGFRPLVVEHFDAEEYNRPAFHIADLLRARSTLEGKHPNAESQAAIQELEDGGGETFSSVDDLMKDLESDD
jgi:hypothetical protein